MRCNIDAHGRSVRLATGLVALAAGFILIIYARRGIFGDAWAWPIGIFLVIVGGFAMFEGYVGWCALRAMGIRTKV
ncbi:MAG: DUF2892 domain-containing protein [Phycisphaeraceae bacterium]|nr:DUF2892 domain-containing protein [Phycisphaeraceae bacterium]